MVSIVSHLRKVAEFIVAFTAKDAPISIRLETAKKQLSANRLDLAMNLLDEALKAISAPATVGVFKKIQLKGEGPSTTLYTKYSELVNAAKKSLIEFRGGKADKKVDTEKSIDEALKLVKECEPMISEQQKVVRADQQ